jgi:hypothetical protein
MRTFFSVWAFLKNLFGKKRIEKERIIKEERKKKESKRLEFQFLIEDIEKNREKIIKDKKERELIIVENGIVLDKKGFIFDKEGVKLFQEEFNTPEYELSISYERKSYYLVRKNKKTGKKALFHRLLMGAEINEFCIKNNCTPEDVEIHHKTNCGDNSKENLEVMTIEEHRNKHPNKN